MSFLEKCRLCRINLIIQGICVIAVIIFIAVDMTTKLYAFLMFFLRFLAVTIFVYNMFSIMIKLGKAKKLASALRWVMRVGYAVWLASFIIVLCLLIVYNSPDAVDDADYIIVLGAGLYGTEPSPILRSRLNKAYEMMQKFPDVDVILCGGQGPDEQIPEAQAMFNYLVLLGADEERLIRESESGDTNENLKNASDIIFEREGTRDKDVVLVTSGFHMMRSKLIAEKYGMAPYAATSESMPEEYHYYLREYFSLIIYTIELTGISIDTSVLGL